MIEDEGDTVAEESEDNGETDKQTWGRQRRQRDKTMTDEQARIRQSRKRENAERVQGKKERSSEK